MNADALLAVMDEIAAEKKARRKAFEDYLETMAGRPSTQEELKEMLTKHREFIRVEKMPLGDRASAYLIRMGPAEQYVLLLPSEAFP